MSCSSLASTMFYTRATSNFQSKIPHFFCVKTPCHGETKKRRSSKGAQSFENVVEFCLKAYHQFEYQFEQLKRQRLDLTKLLAPRRDQTPSLSGAAGRATDWILQAVTDPLQREDRGIPWGRRVVVSYRHNLFGS